MALGKKQRSLTDSELVTACCSGDAAAWDELLRRHGGLIFSAARRMGLSPMDAEDVFQNVCIRLLEHLQDLRDTARLTGWLLIVTRREALRWIQRQRPTVEFPETDLASDALEPEEALLALAERSLLENGIARLPDRCRSLLTALYLTEPAPSYDDVARERGWPLGSVGPNRARCLERLRVELKILDF